MKSALLITSLFIGSSFAVAASPGFFLEAGAGYAFLHGADYASSGFIYDTGAAQSTITGSQTVDEEDGVGTAVLAAGYTFSERFGVRLSYQNLGRATTTFTSDVVIANDVIAAAVHSRYSDQVEIVALAPEFRWAPRRNLTLVFTPEANWVRSDAEIAVVTNHPAISVAPRSTRTRDEITLGGGVAGEWSVTAHLALVTRYQYVNLEPSWGRHAQIVTGTLQWRF